MAQGWVEWLQHQAGAIQGGVFIFTKMYIDYINIHNYTYIDMTYIQIKTGAKAKTIMTNYDH